MMDNLKKSLFIVSLNSQKLKMVLDHKKDPSINCQTQTLDVFVFDTMEILNGLFLNEKNVDQQNTDINKIIDELNSKFIDLMPTKRKLVKCSRVRSEINPYVAIIYNEYYSNSSFERHCKNQIFQNLQPKLKKYGIVNNKSNLIEILVPFLLTEIGLFVSIFDKGIYQCIYGLESEMDIIKSIRNKKYGNFTQFLKYDIQYKQININYNA